MFASKSPCTCHEPIESWRALEQEYLQLGGRLDGSYVTAAGSGGGAPSAGVQPAQLDEVLKRLYAQIHASAKRDPAKPSSGRPRTALCLSGGGIRSATLNLGVMQALAEYGFLKQFDYLSTVSGGGYVGSWFSSWRYRARGGIDDVINYLPTSGAIEAELSPDPRPAEVGKGSPRTLRPSKPEAEPISHLRRHSRFLSPRIGFLSGDVWTVAVTYLRNLSLNWLVLIPLLLAILMIPRLFLSFADYLGSLPTDDGLPTGQVLWWMLGTIGLGAASFMYAGRWTPGAMGDKSYRLRTINVFGLLKFDYREGGRRHFIVMCWLPLMICAFIFPMLLGVPTDSASGRGDQTGFALAGGYTYTFAIGAGFGLVSYLFLLIRRGRDAWPHIIGILPACIAFGASLVGCAAILKHIAGIIPDNGLIASPQVALVCFGPPLLLLALSIGGTVYVGCVSILPSSRDPDREWWARFGAWVMAPAVLWLGFSSLVLIAPQAFLMFESARWGLGGGGIAAAIVSLVIGRSERTKALTENVRRITAGDIGRRWALKLAAPAFVGVMIAVMSLTNSGLLLVAARQQLPGFKDFFIPTSITYHAALLEAPAAGLLIMTGVLASFGLVMSLLIQLNRFSMHALYRNRLIRAYLGASRFSRSPNPFTGFDQRDNVYMHELRPELLRVRDITGDGFVLKLIAAYDQRGPSPSPRPFLGKLVEQIAALDSGVLDRLKSERPLTPGRAEGPESTLQRIVSVVNDLMLTKEWARDQDLASVSDAERGNPEAFRASLEGASRLPVVQNRLILQEAFRDDIKAVTLGEITSDRPLHVINMALNLVSGDDPAWQDRKAESFTASPLHSGSFNQGYRVSRFYGGPRGISLGTAMTISGAALSPNSGYHSSVIIGLLMTFFNIRLGWWLGNPGRAGRTTYGNQSPRLSVWPIVFEALGMTNNNRGYVYLSDGGHFDNLGLYEMVRRRCHVIVVCDAACDECGSFDDLGRAMDRINVDLGVSINFGSLDIRPRSWQTGQPPCAEGKRCAIAEIDYRSVDGPDAVQGVLIYIKSSLYGNEPRNVLSYAASSTTFPHESTADQFFSESQFEAYRTLGRFVVDSIMEAGEQGNWKKPRKIDELVYRAGAHANSQPSWYWPGGIAPKAGSEIEPKPASAPVTA